ncbi:response regulator transcription factor [Subsaximicrobium wynnwilliamsii]|uniref:Response regulator transcription factor n=1 Tax=Subsaximicrobium wynnwilliamsii TaxID=291179 RepID=A0A5C6ZGG5_9FLAO|nr:response regulator [Subsaximicrobium wynnwilliamsii]TXD82118.1 response regulator transcription factor [Subsaximicrobium wynnwilliamsii]TXD87763.1 response regulator transcription factor [Subsaximicrobium wynnwilliamsii]TXE01574.1 response regulator transcription factor [Subsaximicrobium wynnwilliamsii]
MNILIIDDHPQIAESFKSALHKIALNNSRFKFEITEETTLDGSYALLTDSKKIFYDLIFLDIKLPSSKDGKLLSGEDLGLEIRKQSPKSKIIVATTYNDNYRINNIFRNLSPEGLLIKNDLTPKVLVNAIEEVLDDSLAYTKTVKKLLRILASNDISLDYVDRQILYQLSIGTKMMDLPNVITMSIGGIERRKRQLKEAFDIVGKDDKVLLKIARDKGFI